MSPWVLRWFRWYATRYVARHFHAVRLGGGQGPLVGDAGPLVVFMNHASWWDPLVGLLLARRLWPERRHFAPIDAEALSRYRLLGRIGLFGVDGRTPRGAAAFLRTSLAVLAGRDTALWITPEGQFCDPRRRPVRLRPGLAHLARRLPRASLVPVAVEYSFWDERLPEVLVRPGRPIATAEVGPLSVAGWNALLAERLAEAQDRLAEQAIERAPPWETLVRGRSGVSAVYDGFRRAGCWLRGRTFRSEHGSVGR